MLFRTEIDIPKKRPFVIDHTNSITMLGSCFTDNIGALLESDGFNVVHNPMGPLYNAASISQAISLALIPETREKLLLRDDSSLTHCLDFASRYQSASRQELIERLSAELDQLAHSIRNSSVVIITLGTSYVFSLADEGPIVGNCHKFPASIFERRMLSDKEVSAFLREIIAHIPEEARIIFTVSPIRHTADGLHGNQLSKATLLTAVDMVVDDIRTFYFPSYEIMLDDLRDYRFYDSDMKHPSAVAVDYIYEVFSKYFFTTQTISKAALARKQSKRDKHREIIQRF